MTPIVSTSTIEGEVYKLRLRRGTTPPPPLDHCRPEDPYLVEGATSFNVDVTRRMEMEPVSEIGKRGVDYVPGNDDAHAHGWFACFFYHEDEDTNSIIRDLLSLRLDGADESFYADVYYEDGRSLTVPIRITKRLDLRDLNKGVKFFFLCTDLPQYSSG